uniref:Reverse transcriptase domain-containing protein n=1 Tax=Tanacetum cinerariifolium TaxID=118510 RepID=A0A6L2MHJ0_TANCI|nr:reverse transcriptase domain-containing protein [Tanacetum cinerariifolium]
MSGLSGKNTSSGAKDVELDMERENEENQGKLQRNYLVMAISIILISLDSSEEIMRTFTTQVILFGMIPTTIPSTVTTVDSPTIPPIAPTIHYTSPFIRTDSSDKDTSKRPPSQNQYEVNVARWRSRVAARSSPPSLPTRDSLPTLHSLSATSSDSYLDTLSDSSSRHSSLGHSISDSPCDSSTAIFARPSCKRSLTILVPVASPVLGTNVRVEVGTVAEEEVESSTRGTTEIGVDRVTHPVVSDDTVEPVREDYPDLVNILVHRVRVIESVQRDQGHRIVATSQQGAAILEMICTLELDNIRLRGMLGVKRQRVDRLRRSMSYAQRDLSLAVHLYVIDELIAKRVAEALKAYDAAKNPETKTEIENEKQDDNVEANGNNGNGNCNGNGNPNVNNRGVVLITRECTYQDFVKCQPLNFKGTEGGVGLTHWFEKMKTVFHDSNYPPKYQVKYASCTLLNGALTWWNSHKRTVGFDVAYAMTWKALMKLMAERFQELTLLYTKMVPEEEDHVKRYIKGLPNNIQGNVIAAEPTRLQDARLNVNGQNVARAYTVGNNVERKAYAQNLPYCNKCRMHHEESCTVKCGNCKRVGHMTRDCKAVVAATAQKVPVGNQMGVTCYECGIQGHYRRLLGHPFNIDLIPVELGSFDVIIFMDWLAKYHTMIICDEKIVRIPYGDEVMTIKGDGYHGGNKSKLSIISEIRAFSQHENESLTDAWLCMKEMLRNCRGHNLSKGNIIKIFYHGLNEITQEVLNDAAGGILLYKTPNQAYQLLEDKVLLKLDWAKNLKTKLSLKKIVAFADEGNRTSDTDKIMARIDAMTIKMDAQYKELQSHVKQPTPDLDDDDIPMSQTFMDLKTQLETVAKNHQASIQNFETKFDGLTDKQSGRPFGSLPNNTQPKIRGNNSKSYQPPQSRNDHVNVVFTRSGKSYNPPDNPNDQQNNSETPINFDSNDEDDEPAPQPKTQPPKPVKETSIDEILEEDFDALLNEGSKILHFIKGTILEQEIFYKFDKFLAMASNENNESELDEEELKFKKITNNTDYKIKTSLEEPPTDLKLKPLPDNLEYVFLEEPSFLPIIISSQLSP